MAPSEISRRDVLAIGLKAGGVLVVGRTFGGRALPAVAHGQKP